MNKLIIKFHPTNMINIAIFGGGIGGLTVAQQLSKFPQYRITIYEKLNNIGGMARSFRDSDGCATEYCWRVYFNFYKNLFPILNEIPIEDGKTVFNNLTPYKSKLIVDLSSLLKEDNDINTIRYLEDMESNLNKLKQHVKLHLSNEHKKYIQCQYINNLEQYIIPPLIEVVIQYL